MPVSAELQALVSAGRFRDALEHYHGAPSQVPAPSADDRLLAATAAGHLGQLDLGASLAEEAQSDCRARDDVTGVMRSAHLLGSFAFERGRLRDAEAHFGEAIRLAESEGDVRQVAKTANNLATVAHLSGRTEFALGLYERAIAGYRRLGDDAGVAETCHNLALVHRDQARMPEAADACERAVGHARMARDSGLLALVLAGRAELATHLGDLDAAARDLTEARPLALAGSDAPALAEVERLDALVLLAGGDAGAAYESALRGWLGAGLHGHALLESECAAACALALKALGREGEGQGFVVEAQRRWTALGMTARAQRLAREWSST
jgi:tetratricopeptide (TPR) repeat protein